MGEYKTKYNPPDYNQINCISFGHLDGMNGCCHYCLEETPYQWEMCSDESWKRGLMSEISKIPNCTEEQAIEFINNYKRKYFKD
jgi:hypothetical protein